MSSGEFGLESKNNDFNKDFLNSLEEIMGHAGSGNFAEECILPSGQKVTHSFSLATGMAAKNQLFRYRSKFGFTPKWLDFCHPYHRRSLCRLAIGADSPLPEGFAYLLPWVQGHLANLHKAKGIAKTKNLVEVLPVLVGSKKLCDYLYEQFKVEDASSMIAMMRQDKFIGEIGDELHDFLIDEIANESELIWEGVILGSEDEFSIGINGYHGIYYVWAVEYDDQGFFVNIDDAKDYIISNGFFVIDKRIT